ncbi:hypothetical protein HN51_069519, partial [Arachis hypogaea]
MSDLRNDRPSTTQFKDKLPWFLSSLPSADCAKEIQENNAGNLGGLWRNVARTCIASSWT